MLTKKYNNGDVYEGEVINDLPNGYGTYRYSIGDKYVGYFKDGKINGKGTYTFKDGSRLEAEFENGLLNGFCEKFDVYGNSIDMGYYKDGKKHGQWILNKYHNYEKKDFYASYLLYYDNGKEVDYDVNKKETVFTKKYSNGSTYQGELLNDKPHGYGTYILANGNKYVGEMKDGKFNGKGTYTYKDGSKIVGEFANDLLNGLCEKFDMYGNVVYLGNYKDGKRHGQGVINTYYNYEKRDFHASYLVYYDEGKEVDYDVNKKPNNKR